MSFLKTIFVYLLFVINLFVPCCLAAQLSLKNPAICHNNQNKLTCYNDGSFIYHFANGHFLDFTTIDGSIRFFEKGRKLEVYNKDRGNDPVSIYLEGKTVVIAYQADVKRFDSITTNTININGIYFSSYKNSWHYGIDFSLNDKTVRLYFEQGYSNHKWYWEDISVIGQASTFDLRYNPVYYKGPQTISRQDQKLRYGINIAGSFKTSRRIWYVYPVFYEETEKAHVSTILSDFEFTYRKNGKLKKRKSFGEVKHCDCK